MIKWLIEKKASEKILTLNNVLYRNIKNYSIFVNKKEDEIYENNEDDVLTKLNIDVGKKLIVVHEKYKIQVSLCIDRFPINYVQEKFEEDFQNFRDEWLIKTNNNLDVNEEFFHMKYNLSNLNEKQKEKDNDNNNVNDDDGNNEREELDEQNEHMNNNTYNNNNNNNTKHKLDNITNNNVNNMESINELSMEHENLEKLFSLEGIQDIFNKKEEKKKNHLKDKKNKKDENINEYDYKNIKRKPNDFLYLLVKYKHLNKWMFPIMDFKKNYSIRQNLQYLCMQQLKCNTLPFFIGYSPCTYEKRKYKTPLLENEIIGRKIFYYRAHYIKQHTTWNILMNEDIQDVAWLTRYELKNFLSPNRYYVIKDALPLT